MEPIKATLTKHRIRAIVERIEAGESLEPEGTGWTLIDCLTVAGVLLAYSSAGAQGRTKLSGGWQRVDKMLDDLQATTEFIGAMTTACRSGTWDEYFEPSVTIGIRADGGVTPLEGFKR
jgi:hypothetical protein